MLSALEDVLHVQLLIPAANAQEGVSCKAIISANHAINPVKLVQYKIKKFVQAATMDTI